MPNPNIAKKKNSNENQFATVLLITIVISVLFAPLTAGLSILKGLIFIGFFCMVRIFSKSV